MTPIIPRGMDNKTMMVFLKELNWSIRSNRIKNPAIGSLAATAPKASALASLSPPKL
jgi:hypothetical protein